jgi:molecular chaperone HscB
VTNHYTIFPTTLPQGPPPNSSFIVDVAALRREFLQLQGAIHPDKFPQGPEKQRAEALSSRINDAYRTLIDPLSRAQYLLAEIHGIDVLAEDGASKYALDSETLMEIMDVQETVEELSSAPVAEAEATVNGLREENAGRIAESVTKLQKAFDEGDIETAQMETVRLRFWYSLRDGLKEWEHGHGEIRIVH